LHKNTLFCSFIDILQIYDYINMAVLGEQAAIFFSLAGTTTNFSFYEFLDS